MDKINVLPLSSMKSNEQYFPVVLFVTMYKMVPPSEALNTTFKRIDYHLTVVLFIMLCEVNLTCQ